MGLTDPREPAAVHSCHPAGQRAGADRTRPDFSGGKAGLVVGTFVFVVMVLVRKATPKSQEHDFTASLF